MRREWLTCYRELREHGDPRWSSLLVATGLWVYTPWWFPEDKPRR